MPLTVEQLVQLATQNAYNSHPVVGAQQQQALPPDWNRYGESSIATSQTGSYKGQTISNTSNDFVLMSGGSEFTNPSFSADHIIANAANAIGVMSPHVNTAVAYATGQFETFALMLQDNPNAINSFTLAGHSLGYADAQAQLAKLYEMVQESKNLDSLNHNISDGLQALYDKTTAFGVNGTGVATPLTTGFFGDKAVNIIVTGDIGDNLGTQLGIKISIIGLGSDAPGISAGIIAAATGAAPLLILGAATGAGLTNHPGDNAMGYMLANPALGQQGVAQFVAYTPEQRTARASIDPFTWRSLGDDDRAALTVDPIGYTQKLKTNGLTPISVTPATGGGTLYVFESGTSYIAKQQNGIESYTFNPSGTDTVTLNINQSSGLQQYIYKDGATSTQLADGAWKYAYTSGSTVTTHRDGSVTLNINGQTNTFAAADSTYLASDGNWVMSSPNTVTVFNPSNGSSLESNFSSTGALTQTVTTTINGQAVNVTYTYDLNSGEPIAHVNSINGKPPINQASADAALQKINSGQLVEGFAGTDVADAIAANDAAHLNGAQTLAHAVPTLIDALSFISAIQHGQPAPALASGLSFIGQVKDNSTLTSAGSIVNGLMSLNNLHEAFAHGDTGTGLLAGAQAMASISSALSNSTVATEISKALNGTVRADAAGNVTGNVGVLPYANLIYQLDHGNNDAAAIVATDIILMQMGVYAVPVLGWAVAVYSLTDAILSSDSPPEIWGNAHAQWNGFNTVTQAGGISTLYPAADADTRWVNNPDGTRTEIQVAPSRFAISEADDQGLKVAKQTYDGMLVSLNNLIDKLEQQNPSFPLGIVANRMPSITYRDYSGYQLTDFNPITGEQIHTEMLYDRTGRPYNAPLGSELGNWSFGERFILSALARDAIAPMWEVQTAAMQTQAGDPMAGITEEERAGRSGKLAVPLTVNDTAQTFRPVALDLNGDGVQTTGANKTVAFNVDDSGYLKSTAWINNNDGFLFLDRNLNGQMDGGKELFNNSIVALSERGLEGMRWVDANYDGKLSNLDPVWNELKVWQDANGNGLSEAGEIQTLTQLGVTQLNYSMGTFTQNGQVKQLASPDLAADAQGSRITIVQEGILVQTSQGQISLIVTQVDDLSAIEANRDGKFIWEDLEALITEESLLVNDTLAGISTSNPVAGQSLSITDAFGFTHGTGWMDANHSIHYKPDHNFFGEAQFNYTLQASTGQTATATVELTIQNVNDKPSVTIDQHIQPIYGYKSKTFSIDARGIRTYFPSAPQYAPYTGIDYSKFPAAVLNASDFVRASAGDWSATYNFSWYAAVYHADGYHSTPVGTGDIDGVNIGTLVVTDPDGPDTGYTYDVSIQAQKGQGVVDASGNFSYVNWYGPNAPGVSGSKSHYSIQSDAYTITVSDSAGLVDSNGNPIGASTSIQINAEHTGEYHPNLGSGGGGCCPIAIDMDGNGFQFAPAESSDVFFDINADGWKRQVSWPTPGNGWLALDSNGNGKVDDGSEIVFTKYANVAQTDLQSLAEAFDSNKDGRLSVADDKWAKFGVWNDANQNGVSDDGEFNSLTALGVESIELTSDGQFRVQDGNTIHGISTVHMQDGTTLNAADVTLQVTDKMLVPQPDGSTQVVTAAPFAVPEVINGTADKDILLGNNGNTTLNGLAGDDAILSGIGNDVIDGGAGNDLIYADEGNDLVGGGSGDDVIFAGLGNDFVGGGDGHDALMGESGNDVIFAGNGNDFVSGGNGNDVLVGGAGDDQVFGEGGSDALFGEGGYDQLSGMEGDDWLSGGAGGDLLDGGAQNDELLGGDGNDTLIGVTGSDTLHGGTGNDTYMFGRDAGQDTISEADATLGNTDTIKLETGILTADVKLTRDVENLYFNINGTTDRLTLANWFVSDANKVEQATFANGTVWDLSAQAALLSIPTEGDDFLVGTAADDIINGLGGNDTLAGLAGSDYLQGGTGNDTYLFGRNTGLDYVYEYDTTAGNADTIQLAADVGPADVKVTRDADNLYLGIKGTSDKLSVLGWFVSDANRVEQASFADGTVWDAATLATKAADTTLTADDGNNPIVGTAGSDTLVGNANNNLLDGGAGADAMIGGAGDDTYVVDNTGDLVIENPNAGNDSVHANISYVLTDNVENLTLTGNADLNGTGNTLNNFMTGNSGSNLLDGEFGADLMSGGLGDDTYVVDDVGDRVVENPDAGHDIVLSSVGYSLTANVESLTLTGNADISAAGNTLDNVITGNSGNNRIDGGVGADAMTGGAGNDTYLVDNAGDVVVEQADAGLDTVLVGFDYTLGGNVESLVLTGTDNIYGTGNALNNLLAGNAGNNLLNGGQGRDVMQGGAGDDTYIVDNTGDIVLENADSGNDTVDASVTYALAAELENLLLTGNADIGGTGNELDNVITGNSGANRIDAGLGVDTMQGGTGDDTYLLDNVGDLVIEGINAGVDSVESSITYTLTDNTENLTLVGMYALNGSGNALDNAITGNIANNLLDGAAGADVLAGGAGDETYIVDNIADVVVENPDEGTDIVYASASYGLSGNVENLTLTSTADIDGTGNELDNLIIGNDGANALTGLDGNDILIANDGGDLLDGGLGMDTMLGGAGDDTYVVDDTGDVVTEALNAGIDMVESVITYTLTVNVENLALTGTQDVNGTGNSLDNIVIGNNGNNILMGLVGNDTLDGNLGADTMLGGAENDTYVVDNTGDLVTEYLNQGADLVRSSITYVLTVNVENLTLTGNADINGTGNKLDNIITGNHGNNILMGLEGKDTLDGGIGADTMLGGKGDDIYVVDNASDLVIEYVSEDDHEDGREDSGGTDLVLASISYTLTDNVENLTLTGNAGINGTGNNLDNIIAGNSDSNTLLGLQGNDTLVGGLGADTMIGGAGADIIDLTETTQALDIVVINAGDSLVKGIDKIYQFNAAAVLNDQLDFASAEIAANSVATDGINYHSIKSHSITNGMVTFDNLNAYAAPSVINADTVEDVNKYLATNIASGKSVAFYVDANRNGSYADATDYLRVFQGGATAAGTLSGDDIFVNIYTTSGLGGVTALGLAAAANTVQIV